MNFSRRSFLKASALGLTATAFSARSWAQVADANSDVRVAVIGLNGRGKNHLTSLAKIPGVRVVAICDPDVLVLERTFVPRRGQRLEDFIKAATPKPGQHLPANHGGNHGGVLAGGDRILGGTVL